MNKIGKGQHRDAKYQISKLLSVSEKNFEVGFLSSYDPTCDQLVTPVAGPVLTPQASYKQTWKRSTRRC